jgi:hypothetical protein
LSADVCVVVIQHLGLTQEEAGEIVDTSARSVAR